MQLTFGGEAEASRYVVGGTTTITLGAGVPSSTATVTIDPVNNELSGGNKDIEVSGIVTGSDLNVQTAAEKIEIVDDEPAAALTLTSDPSSISEGARATAVTMKAELNVGMEKEATVALKVVPAGMDEENNPTGSSATGDGTDYTIGELMSIVIPAGSKSASSTVMITPVDDNLHEGDEKIVISGEGSGLSGTAEITLLGNDYDVRLSSDPSEVTEGDDATDIVITADLAGGSRSYSLTVNIGIVGQNPPSGFSHNTGVEQLDGSITAGSGDDDVSTLTIPAGMTTGTATISINPAADDNAYSGDRDIKIVGTTTDGLNVKGTKVILRDLQRASVDAHSRCGLSDGGGRHAYGCCGHGYALRAASHRNWK